MVIQVVHDADVHRVIGVKAAVRHEILDGPVGQGIIRKAKAKRRFFSDNSLSGRASTVGPIVDMAAEGSQLFYCAHQMAEVKCMAVSVQVVTALGPTVVGDGGRSVVDTQLEAVGAKVELK